MAVSGSSTGNSAGIVQSADSGLTSQQWQIQPVSGNLFNLINRNSGLALDINMASHSHGGQAIQYQYRGGNNQLWSFEPAPAGAWVLRNFNSQQVLDVAGGSSNAGGSLDQWIDVSGANQQWSIQAVNPWVACAQEGATCVTSGTVGAVRYGAAGAYLVQQVSGSTPCTNAAFGGDPLFGAVKQCSTLPLPGASTAWTVCAADGGTCPVSGTHVAAYGANGHFVFLAVSAPFACASAAFGADPAVGTVKTCFVD